MPPKKKKPAEKAPAEGAGEGEGVEPISRTPPQRNNPFAVDSGRASERVRSALDRSSETLYACDMQQTLSSDRERQIAKQREDVERMLNASKQVMDNHGKEIIELENKHRAEMSAAHDNATEEIENEYKTRLNEARLQNLKLKKENESVLKDKNKLLAMSIDAIVDVCNMHVMFFNSSPWRSFYGDPVYEYFKQYFTMLPLPGKAAFPEYEPDTEISAILDRFADRVFDANAKSIELSKIKTYVYDCASGLLSVRLPGVPYPQGLAEMKCGSRILTPQAQEAALSNEGDGYYAVNFNNVITENNELDGYAAFKSSLMYAPLKFPIFEATAVRDLLSFDSAEEAHRALDEVSTRAMLAVTRAPSADLAGIRLRSTRESRLAIALNNINEALGITGDVVTINADEDRVDALVKKSQFAVKQIIELKKLNEEVAADLSAAAEAAAAEAAATGEAE